MAHRTEIKLLNQVGDTIISPTPHLTRYWHGNGHVPARIADRRTGVFHHQADGRRSSVGALVYLLEQNQGIKWIVAWSNLDNSKKVYTDFIDDDSEPDWPAVKANLDNCSTTSTAQVNEYRAYAVITTDNATPTLVATLDKDA